MTQPAPTHDVVVRKDIKLETGESISDFTRKARESGVKYIRQQLNLDKKESGVYPIEIFSKSMVFDVYKYSPANEDDRIRYYACAYTRKNDGTFDFSTLTEVERVTMYQPKSTAMVTKSADEGDHPGWDVKKSVWHGVI